MRKLFVSGALAVALLMLLILAACQQKVNVRILDAPAACLTYRGAATGGTVDPFAILVEGKNMGPLDVDVYFDGTKVRTDGLLPPGKAVDTYNQRLMGFDGLQCPSSHSIRIDVRNANKPDIIGTASYLVNVPSPP
jgi:hypothetical protein